MNLMTIFTLVRKKNSYFNVVLDRIGFFAIYRLQFSMFPIVQENFIESYAIFDNKLWTSIIAVKLINSLTKSEIPGNINNSSYLYLFRFLLSLTVYRMNQ